MLLGQSFDWDNFVETSERYLRPNEVDFLLGDSSKAQKKLGWKPKVSFQNLVKKMVEEDLILAQREKVLLQENLIYPTWENHT